MKKTKKSTGLHIRIEPDLLNQLREFAARYQVHYSQVVRLAIKQYLETHQIYYVQKTETLNRNDILAGQNRYVKWEPDKT